MYKQIWSVVLILVGIVTGIKAQQTSQFSQYLFNNYGFNPAAVGQGDCIELKMGRRDQWAGFPNAPVTSFFSVTKNLGRKGFKKGWHTVGLYAEVDKAGLFKTESAYPSYAFNLKVSRRYTASFGTFVGIRRQSVSNILRSPGDPALSDITPLLIYPDISFGVKVYSKTAFVGLSVRQIYKNSMRQGGKQIGTPATLKQHYFLTLRKRIESSSYYYSYIPSVLIKYALFSPPSVDINFMMFVKNKIGFGLGYRYNDALIGIVQMKLGKFTSIGISYDYTLSKIRAGGGNSREFMMGYTPCGAVGEFGGSVKGCPAYDY